MSVAGSSGSETHLRGNAALREKLATALELEDGQLTHFPAAGGPTQRPGGRAKQAGPSLQDLLGEAKLTTARSHKFVSSTAILWRHWQRKSSLEEVILELYHGNISVAKADGAARLLWGESASAALLGEHVPGITHRVQSWLAREISAPQPYVFLHSLTVKQKIFVEKKVASLVAAVGIRSDGNREVLGVLNATGPGREAWSRLLSHLKQRGLHGTTLFVGENDPAAPAAVRAHFPRARYQGSCSQLEREVLAKVRPAEMHAVMNAFASIRASTAQRKAAAALAALAARLAQLGATEAAALLETTADFQLNFHHFPGSHWPRIQDAEYLGRVLRQFREWIRVIGPVADDHVLTLMAAARLRSVARLSWARRRYLKF